MSPISSTVIQDIKAMCKAGDASMAYFYFDFRNAGKQGLQDLVRSLLTQLSAQSARRCDTLRNLYSAHDEGKNQPGDSDLTECLKEMLTFFNQCPTYLIIDALDESPNSPGIPSPREKVLRLVEELIELCLPNLRICVTSRPEIDIRNVLEPLTFCRVSLHDQSGQKEDIAAYVRSVVYSKSEQIMRRWRTEDKELVIKSLSERADGMYVNHSLYLGAICSKFEQVPLGVLSAGSSTGLSSTKCPAYPRRITGIVGRDIRAYTEGNQEAEPRSRSAVIVVPCCGCSATSSQGACRGPCG